MFVRRWCALFAWRCSGGLLDRERTAVKSGVRASAGECGDEEIKLIARALR